MDVPPGRSLHEASKRLAPASTSIATIIHLIFMLFIVPSLELGST